VEDNMPPSPDLKTHDSKTNDLKTHGGRDRERVSSEIAHDYSPLANLALRKLRIGDRFSGFRGDGFFLPYGEAGQPIGSTEPWEAAVSQLPSTVRTVSSRRTIIHPRDWSEFVPVICEGWAALAVTLPDGRRQILSFLLPGDLASAASIFQAIPGRSLEAISDVTYRSFKRDDLKAILSSHPGIMDRLSSIMIAERVWFGELVVGLGRRLADERIARLILYLAGRLANRGLIHDRSMDFPLRQRHIADAMGLSPVHVNRILTDFQRIGIIELKKRSLTIIDEAELRRVAGWDDGSLFASGFVD
jgi:CRP-like cAMP-binding protein